MRGLIETAVATTAVLLATVWSTGPAAATMVDNLAGAVRASTGVDRTHLPIGDGKLSRSPTVGSVWSCQTSFASNAGAFTNGPWMRSDGTYDDTARAVVDGQVSWPSQFTVEQRGATRVVAGNGLPDHPTGTYPVARSDDAYQYDRNPNTISAQTISFTLPATPSVASQPACVPGGPIGVLLTGSVFFNALDAEGRDAVAHELQDACQGHPERTGSYHYHNLTSCLDDGSGSGHSPLMGYAFDGFGIYGHHGEGGAALSNADLDACHGHTHTVQWDGQNVELYHYHATWEYPYTIGCFKGTPAVSRQGPGGPGGPGNGASGPGIGASGPGMNGPTGGGPGNGGPGAGGPSNSGGPGGNGGLGRPPGPPPGAFQGQGPGQGQGQGQGQGFFPPPPPGFGPPPPPRQP